MGRDHDLCTQDACKGPDRDGRYGQLGKMGFLDVCARESVLHHHADRFFGAVRDDYVPYTFLCHEGRDIDRRDFLREGKHLLVHDIGEPRFHKGIKTGASSPYRSSMNRVSGFTSPHRVGTYRPGSDRFLNSTYPITLVMLSVSGFWCPKR